MVRPLSLAQHTLYADLLEQGDDDLFDPDLPENGSILVRGNRTGAPAEHAYYQGYGTTVGDTARGQRYTRYLGRIDNPEVAARIARFQRIKAVRAERTSTVRALTGAGMPKPDRTTGRIIEALARARLFPDHAVLIAAAAFRTYDGVLGVRSAKSRNAACRTWPTVEIVVRDGHRLAEILAALHAVDPSFALEAASSGSYRSATSVKVAVTTLDRADEETASLIGYLIANPVRAVVLHGPGIPVCVPAPERYAVHTLIREEAGVEGAAAMGRAHSNPGQAAELIDALVFAHRNHALSDAFTEVRKVCPQWLRSLTTGIARLPHATRMSLSEVS
ncbi:hypothetical protein ADL19_10470 [Streptomyces purpurogeneiscleroticus]|nr:hypothetical protein ADL19_10470 [Streptomyces purpurogeneiscleroticus]